MSKHREYLLTLSRQTSPVSLGFAAGDDTETATYSVWLTSKQETRLRERVDRRFQAYLNAVGEACRGNDDLEFPNEHTVGLGYPELSSATDISGAPDLTYEQAVILLDDFKLFE